MVTMVKNAKEITSWRSALSALPDSVFLDVMRIYLGEIKTPFNKPSLLEQLGTFLRKPQHIAAICSYITENDSLVLTAVSLLSHPTLFAVTQLLNGFIPVAKIADCIHSLEERLVLYRVEQQDVVSFYINPYLQESVASFIAPQSLFPTMQKQEITDWLSADTTSFYVDDLMLAGLFCRFRTGCDLIKQDGSFKKKPLDVFTVQFPALFAVQNDNACSGRSLFDVLFYGLRNMQLLTVGEYDVSARFENWLQFATLTQVDRLLYIAVASTGRTPRSEIVKKAELLKRFLNSLPADGCSIADARRLYFLVAEHFRPTSAEQNEQRGCVSRLAQLLDSDPAVKQSSSSKQDSYNDQLIDTLLLLGVLSYNRKIIKRNPVVKDSFFDTKTAVCGAVMVDPSGMITIFPYLPLSELLPLMSFIGVESVQTAGTFTISKSMALDYFATGNTADGMLNCLQKWSGSPIPQNITFLIHEWFSSYGQVSLVQGFVLCAKEEQRSLIENNRNLSSAIQKVLAPGVYLLSVRTEKEAEMLLKSAGVDIPAITINTEQAKISPFMVIPDSDSYVLPLAPVVSVDCSRSNDSLRDELMHEIDQMELTREQRESLTALVQRRVILSVDQLNERTVRFEKNEARGVDFLGKVRLAESAVAEYALLEIVSSENSKMVTVCGLANAVQKRGSDVFVTVIPELDDSQDQQDLEAVTLSLAKAVVVRKKKRSIFSSILQ